VGPVDAAGRMARTVGGIALGATLGAGAVAVVVWALPTSARVEPLDAARAEVVARVAGEPIRRWDLQSRPGPPDPARLAEGLRLRVEGAMRIRSAERWGIGVTREEELAAARRAWGADRRRADPFLRIFVDNQLRRFRNEADAAPRGSEAGRRAESTVAALETLRDRDFTIEELGGLVPAWEIERMEQARWRVVVTWAREALFRWKHDLALHGRYGGAVVERGGRAIPVEARGAWLREEAASGGFEILDPALAGVFWSWYAPAEGEPRVEPGSAFAEPPRFVAPDPTD
jgi:hypothetical protein